MFDSDNDGSCDGCGLECEEECSCVPDDAVTDNERARIPSFLIRAKSIDHEGIYVFDDEW